MGSSNSPLDSHPRYGFSETELINEALTDESLSGTSTLRVPGLLYAVVMGTFTLTSGSGVVQLLVEGTNDGTNWVTLGATSPTENFTTDAQFQLLNAVGTGQVSLQHWNRVRVRAVIVSGTPVFSLACRVAGIARDGEKFMRGQDLPFARSGATPTTQNSSVFNRPAGTMLANCQVVASGVVLDGLTGFYVRLQGSPEKSDAPTVWVTIAESQITASGAVTLLDANTDAESFFSLSQYFRFRFQVVDNGSAGASTAFTALTFYLTLDDSDWVIDGEGEGSSGIISDAFVSVQFASPAAEVGQTRNITGQIYGSDGAPLAEARKIELILYDTALAGDVDLSTNGTFTAVVAGTAVLGLTTNRLVLTTTATGAFTVTVTDASVETIYITAVNPQGPNTVPQVIMAAGQGTLSFT